MSSEVEDAYFDVPGVARVRWDSGLEAVVVEWAGFADPMEFTALLDAEIRALRDHRGKRLLADCRLQKIINPAAQDWGDREWLPRALAAGLKRFAIVRPLSGVAASNLEERLNRVPKEALQVGYFDSVDEATAWLTAP